MESRNDDLQRHSAKRFLAFIISSLQVLAATLVLSPTLVNAAAETKITHSFLALGGETYIVSDAGKIEWTYPFSTRDGWVLADGNLLLTLSKCDNYPGGAVVE